MKVRSDIHLPHLAVLLFFLGLFFFAAGCRDPKSAETLPDMYKQSGAFIKSLPYFNPDSCVLLVRRDVPPRWQGAAYENLILDGPEDSPLALGFQHLDYYERNFPADTARAFVQLWRGRLGHPDTAQACLQESYELSMKAKNYLRAGDAQGAMAAIFYQKGKTADALRSFLAVYDAVKNLDSSQIMRKITAIGNIAAAYHQSRNFREALSWEQRRRPLVADESIESLRTVKVNHFKQCGGIYAELKMPDSAIIMYQNALNLQEKYQTINDRSILLSKLGSAYLEKGDCPAALRQLLEARRIQRADNAYAKDELSLNQAEAYFCLGRLDSAEIFARSGLQSPFPPLRLHANSIMAKLYAQQGKYKAAYDALQTRLDIGQKGYNIEKIQEMGAAKVEVELDRAKLRLEQIAQKEKNERQQKLIIGLVALMGLGFVAAFIMRLRGRRRILEQQKELLEKDNNLLAQEKELAEARENLKIQELERSKTALKKSQKELKSTKEELKTAAQLLAVKNQFIEEMQMRLTDQHVAPDDESIPSSSENHNLRGMKILTAEDWGKFRQRFEEYFPGFLINLKVRFPDLTAAETRLFLLMKLNFDTTEIAETLGISQGSVWRSRYRLSKKLELPETSDLDAFILQFE